MSRNFQARLPCIYEESDREEELLLEGNSDKGRVKRCFRELGDNGIKRSKSFNGRNRDLIQIIDAIAGTCQTSDESCACAECVHAPSTGMIFLKLFRLIGFLFALAIIKFGARGTATSP